MQLVALVICLPFVWLTVMGVVEVMTVRPPRLVEPELAPARLGKPVPLPRTQERDWGRIAYGLFKVIVGVPIAMFTGLMFLFLAGSDLMLFAGEMLALATVVAAILVGIRRAHAYNAGL
jgi:hypothetical protein